MGRSSDRPAQKAALFALRTTALRTARPATTSDGACVSAATARLASPRSMPMTSAPQLAARTRARRPLPHKSCVRETEPTGASLVSDNRRGHSRTRVAFRSAQWLQPLRLGLEPCEGSSKYGAARYTDRIGLAGPVPPLPRQSKAGLHGSWTQGWTCATRGPSPVFLIWRRTLSNLANGGEFFEGVFISALGIVDQPSRIRPQVTRPGSVRLDRRAERIGDPLARPDAARRVGDREVEEHAVERPMRMIPDRG